MGFFQNVWNSITGRGGSSSAPSSSLTNSTSTPKPSPSPAPVYQSTPTNEQQVQQNFQESVYSGGSGGGYTPPLGGGGSGAGTAAPRQSTPSNKTAVQLSLSSPPKSSSNPGALSQSQFQNILQNRAPITPQTIVRNLNQRAQQQAQKSSGRYLSQAPYMMTQSRPLLGGKGGQSSALNLSMGPTNASTYTPLVAPFVPKSIADIYKKAFSTVYNFLDTYSGGKLTDARLNDLQTQLNNKWDNYSKNYYAKSFKNESDYAKANAMYLNLATQQKAIDLAKAGEEKKLQALQNAVAKASNSPNRTLGQKIIDLGKKISLYGTEGIANVGVGVAQTPKSLKNLALVTIPVLAVGASAAVKKAVKNPAQTIVSLNDFTKKTNILLQFAKNPKGTTKAFKQGFKQAGQTVWNLPDVQLIRTDPVAGIAKVGTELGLTYLTFKVTDSGLRITGKLGKKAITRLSPYFKKFSTETPMELTVKGGGKVYLKGGLLSSESRSLSRQTSIAGTRRTITTAQANKLVGFIKRSKIVRKPIPGENLFTKTTKALLKKFDEGRLTAKQFNALNKRVLKESGKSLLERSLYGTPSGTIRYTRFGEQTQEGNILDLLRGRATLRQPKPQIIVFPEGKISNFPKNLQDVVKKLKSNKKLTAAERTRLIKWQVKQKGANWAPIGDTEYHGGIELEVTLAPGSKIRRVKKLATTEINGQKVTIVQAKVIDGGKEIRTLLNKARKGKLTDKEIIKLQKDIKKKTGLKPPKSSIKKMDNVLSRQGGKRRILEPKKYYPAARKVASKATVASRLSKKTTSMRYSGKVYYASNGRPYVKTPSGNRFVSPSRVSKGRFSGTISKQQVPPRSSTTRLNLRSPNPPVRGPQSRAPYYGRSVPPKRNAPPKIKGNSKSSSQKAVSSSLAYQVYGKSNGKWVKMSKKPLSLQDATARGRYVIDNTTSASFKLKPVARPKRIGSIPAKELNYAKRVDKKFRDYTIRRGRKIAGQKVASEIVIEKRGYRIDTKGEKRGLTIAKYLKQQAKKSPRVGGKIKVRTAPKRKASPAQLKALRKARRQQAASRRKSSPKKRNTVRRKTPTKRRSTRTRR